jgi:hypothetical protein
MLFALLLPFGASSPVERETGWNRIAAAERAVEADAGLCLFSSIFIHDEPIKMC